MNRAMKNVNERTEQLICRMLDSELSEDERLELDRELLRSPEARELLEEYRRIDAMACAAIESAVRPARERMRLVEGRPAARRRSAWMLGVSAVAASIALVLHLATPPAPQRVDKSSAAPMTQASPTSGAHARPLPRVGENWGDVGVWRVKDGPRHVDRKTDRNFLLVPGKDGRIYVVPVDHVREIRREGVNRDDAAGYDPI